MAARAKKTSSPPLSLKSLRFDLERKLVDERRNFLGGDLRGDELARLHLNGGDGLASDTTMGNSDD